MDRELVQARLVAFATVLYAATIAATLGTVSMYLFFEGILVTLGVAGDASALAVRVLVAASLFDAVVVLGGLIVWFLALRYDFSFGALALPKSTIMAMGMAAIPAWFFVQHTGSAVTRFLLLAGVVVGALNLAASILAQLEVPPGTARRTVTAAGLFLLATGGGGLAADVALGETGAAMGDWGTLLLVGATLLLMLGAAAAAYHAHTMWRDVWLPLDRSVQSGAPVLRRE